MHNLLVKRNSIILILIFQFIPILLYPPEIYDPTSQEWWLPVLLAILAAVAVFQIIFRHSLAVWPWHLLAFAHGFNIISRLMMLMPHATIIVDGQQVIDLPYVISTLVAMGLSQFLLWYSELPEVRSGLVRVVVMPLSEESAGSA
jgi:hypothetical protein